MKTQHKNTKAFTLVEIIVVIGLIVLIASIALPSITTLMTSGADAQAYNILAAQLRAARGHAIGNNTFSAVHIQRNPDSGRFYAAVVTLSGIKDVGGTDCAVFDLAGGFEPTAVNPGIEFLDLSRREGMWDADGNFAPNQKVFETDSGTITIVFNPQGRCVRAAGNGNYPVAIDPDSSLLTAARPLWSANRGGNHYYAAGCVGVIIVPVAQLTKAENNSWRAAWLKDNARFCPINQHTGMLYPSE